MEGEKARKLGSLLLLDAPEGMQFGIDNQVWQTGPLFKGVKCIPSGAHFVYYSLKDEDFNSRIGFFIFVQDFSQSTKPLDEYNQRSLCIVKRWDTELQNFTSLSKTDEVSYQEGVRNFDFDKNLAFYFNEQLGQNY